MDAILTALSGLMAADTFSWVQFVFTVIGAAAVAAANLPRGGSTNWFWTAVDYVAQNYNNAKNAS